RQLLWVITLRRCSRCVTSPRCWLAPRARGARCRRQSGACPATGVTDGAFARKAIQRSPLDGLAITQVPCGLRAAARDAREEHGAMPITITDVVAHDIRFPTSRLLDGSDAMNPNPDYSAAYVVLHTD